MGPGGCFRRSRPTRQAGTSAQNQEVEPVGPGFGAGCLLGVLRGAAESFFAAEEFLLGEVAHRCVGAAEGVRLGEKLGEAGPVRLGNLLKGARGGIRRWRTPGRSARRRGRYRPSGRSPGTSGLVRPGWSGREIPGGLARERRAAARGGFLAQRLPGRGCGGSRGTARRRPPSRRASGRALASPSSTWMPGRRGIWARIAADGSTARTLRPNQSLKAAANAPVPAPMSATVIPGTGLR